MEKPAKRGKTHHSASYLTSALVYYGTLLFLASHFLKLILLFAEGIARKREGQALPEQLTFLGIVGLLIVICVIAAAFALLFFARRRLLHMRGAVFYLLLNALFAAWGLIHAVNNLVEMVLFFEFLNLFNFLAFVGAMILPSVLLQLAERKKSPPNDNVILAAAAASLTCAAIAALIIIVLAFRKSYTALPLVRDLLFQAALLFFGAAGLQKAFKLRSELILTTPVERPPEPEYRECPDCGKRLPVKLDLCPRCGYALGAASLFSEDEPDEPPPPATPAPSPAAKPPAPAREIVKKPPVHITISDGTAACERCKRRIPKGLATCPFCGYFPGDPDEPPPKKPEPAAARDVSAAGYSPRADERRACARCGKRVPGGLATCPFCGYFPGDDKPPVPEPERERASAEAPDPYETLFPADLADTLDERRPRPKKKRPVEIPNVRLTEKNSIVCPQCGRKFFAALDECPLCGFGLYDD